MRVLAPVSAPEDPAADDELAVALAATPWSVRCARGPGTRAALELYEAGRLADIIVATPVAVQVAVHHDRRHQFRLDARPLW